jgi:hypothetical protein
MNSIIRIQFMASLGATTFENIPTGLGRHSGTKTVLFDGPAVMGLISTLWHDAPDLSKKNKVWAALKKQGTQKLRIL